MFRCYQRGMVWSLLVMFVCIVLHHHFIAKNPSYCVMDLPLFCRAATYPKHRPQDVHHLIYFIYIVNQRIKNSESNARKFSKHLIRLTKSMDKITLKTKEETKEVSKDLNFNKSWRHLDCNVQSGFISLF